MLTLGEVSEVSFLSLPFPSFIQQMSGNHYFVQLWPGPLRPRDSDQVPDLEEFTEHSSGPPQVRLPQAGNLGDILYKKRPTSWEEKERSGANIAVTEPRCGQHCARCFPEFPFPPHCSTGGGHVLSWFYS